MPFSKIWRLKSKICLTLYESVCFVLSVVQNGVVATDVDYLVVVNGQHTWIHVWIYSVKLPHFKINGTSFGCLIIGSTSIAGPILEHTARLIQFIST